MIENFSDTGLLLLVTGFALRIWAGKSEVPDMLKIFVMGMIFSGAVMLFFSVLFFIWSE